MAEQQSERDAPTESVSAPPSGSGRYARRGGLRTFDSLRDNYNYRFLFAGNLSANGAQWLQIFTVGWLVLSLSEGSALHSVAVAGIRSLPVLALGPWAGVLADRIDRRIIAIATHAAQVFLAVGFAVLIAGDWVQVWHAYSYMLLSGAAHAIQQPVRHALVANTVPRSDLANALALNAMGVNIMRLSGPILGGILISTVGFKWNFFFEAALYLGMVLLLLPMKTPYREASTARRVSAFANLKDGVKYILASSPLRRLTLLNFLRTTVFMPLVLLMPVYTQDALGAGVATGTVMISLMGFGGLTTTDSRGHLGIFYQERPGYDAGPALGLNCDLGLGDISLGLVVPAFNGFHGTLPNTLRRQQQHFGPVPGVRQPQGTGFQRLALRIGVDSVGGGGHRLRRRPSGH